MIVTASALSVLPIILIISIPEVSGKTTSVFCALCPPNKNSTNIIYVPSSRSYARRTNSGKIKRVISMEDLVIMIKAVDEDKNEMLNLAEFVTLVRSQMHNLIWYLFSYLYYNLPKLPL